MKAYDDLFFTDDFLFCKIMEDPEICKGVIEALLDIKIRRIEHVSPQHYLKETYSSHGVRLDVYVQGSDKVFDVEMQTSHKCDEGLRMRYYQSLIDIDQLRKGQTYNTLKESYVIFLCTYDPFKMELPVYTFESKCIEDNRVLLNDKQHKVIYNIPDYKKASKKNTKELLEFFVRKVPTNSITQKITDAIITSKGNEPWRAEYMLWNDQIAEWKQEARKEGLAEGLAEGKAAGLAEGKAAGLAEGKAKGLAEGKAAGLTEGKIEGRLEALIESAVMLVKEFNIAPEAAANKLNVPLSKLQEALI